MNFEAIHEFSYFGCGNFYFLRGFLELQTPLQTPMQTPLPGSAQTPLPGNVQTPLPGNVQTPLPSSVDNSSMYNIPTGSSSDYPTPVSHAGGSTDGKAGRPSHFMVSTDLIVQPFSSSRY